MDSRLLTFMNDILTMVQFSLSAPGSLQQNLMICYRGFFLWKSPQHLFTSICLLSVPFSQQLEWTFEKNQGWNLIFHIYWGGLMKWTNCLEMSTMSKLLPFMTVGVKSGSFGWVGQEGYRSSCLENGVVKPLLKKALLDLSKLNYFLMTSFHFRTGCLTTQVQAVQEGTKLLNPFQSGLRPQFETDITLAVLTIFAGRVIGGVCPSWFTWIYPWF